MGRIEKNTVKHISLSLSSIMLMHSIFGFITKKGCFLQCMKNVCFAKSSIFSSLCPPMTNSIQITLLSEVCTPKFCITKNIRYISSIQSMQSNTIVHQSEVRYGGVYFIYFSWDKVPKNAFSITYVSLIYFNTNLFDYKEICEALII